MIFNTSNHHFGGYTCSRDQSKGIINIVKLNPFPVTYLKNNEQIDRPINQKYPSTNQVRSCFVPYNLWIVATIRRLCGIKLVVQYLQYIFVQYLQ